ncbi:hypothetical protein PBCVAN69C_584L [Paramecium bursaria Chlorella virus AN69C]|uniref:Uncharacterized protein n=1 Tax=Paramecium bursaria Chlorella virus IL3A TaxID=46019 RepID=M1I672_PBCVI|nr:hypothetical protein PBCVAN69C_584L [Paramecium bursaria Chlorella virus AN69C]AGE51612.1 hypothetical protein PBCVCviKI_566R [Paramecium bursaria Chlorella virus CviKI]AGE52629.1 hypothetical protein PBCVCvsA1_583R [Paramecium bursaria Chlorella virus CvsA1]AGE53985.1 hypothetical protein PBCVIL3A_584R [Paramecium bursaria Chlorella virus IL3A]AGE54674.1 hypothetical protein PBCVKS1B_503R [Paramecium bursaria Chlorella virus KS1B]AGE55422.1 hypothetical protein PBCVMA1E_674R [Paramecium bu
MDSRLSAAYAIRAARITQIPGGVGGLVINVAEGGEPRWEQYPLAKQKPLPNDLCYTPTLAEIAQRREAVIAKYTRQPLETGTTYTGVLNASKLNEQYTRVKKSALPDKEFPIIETEKYPEPPILWETTIGAPSRLFDRSDGVKYVR